MQARRIGRSPYLTALAAAPLAAVPFLLIAGLLIHPLLAFITIHATLLGLGLSRFAWVKNPYPQYDPVDVNVDDDVLVVGAEAIPRDQIHAGFVTRGPGGASSVRLRRPWRQTDVELVVDHADDGHALLRALGLAADQTTTEVRGMSLTQRSLKAQVASLFGSFFTGAVLFALLGNLLGGAGLVIGAATAVFLIMGLQIWPSYVRVGADGVLVRWLGYERFYAHADIARVQARVRGIGNQQRHVVQLDLVDGEQVILPITAVNVDTDRAEPLAGRIQEARETHRRGAVVEDAALLRRGDRSPQDWLAHLRALTSRATHRKAAMDLDRLWTFVEGHAYDATTRAAAAAALAPQVSAQERRRLRVAAETTVHPKLRVALDAIADEASEAEIEAALAQLEKEEVKKAQLHEERRSP